MTPIALHRSTNTPWDCLLIFCKKRSSSAVKPVLSMIDRRVNEGNTAFSPGKTGIFKQGQLQKFQSLLNRHIAPGTLSAKQWSEVSEVFLRLRCVDPGCE